jgi:hypothetical protein
MSSISLIYEMIMNMSPARRPHFFHLFFGAIECHNFFDWIFRTQNMFYGIQVTSATTLNSRSYACFSFISVGIVLFGYLAGICAEIVNRCLDCSLYRMMFILWHLFCTTLLTLGPRIWRVAPVSIPFPKWWHSHQKTLWRDLARLCQKSI